jgi:hypothetical protein
VSSRYPTSGPPFGGFSLGGMPQRDILVLLGVLLATLSLRYFEATELLPALLELSPAVWRPYERIAGGEIRQLGPGFVWQLVTYPFVGNGRAGFWFLLELFFLGLFGRDVFAALGRRRFWRLLLGAALAGAVVAVLVQIAGELLTGIPAFIEPPSSPFDLLQGQHTLFAVIIAAFATVYGDATILLFFVLPVRARWFLWLELLFAFLAFLPTHDLAGFLGISAAIGWTWLALLPGTPRRKLREARLRLERWWIQQNLERMRKKRGFRVIPGEGRDPRRGPWTH